MLKNIFLVENNPLISRMIELSLKKADIDCYVYPHPHDGFYLMNDLKPELILLSLQTLKETGFSGELFVEKFHQEKVQASLVAMGTTDEWNELGELKRAFRGLVLKPLSPFKIAEDLRKVYSLH